MKTWLLETTIDTNCFYLWRLYNGRYHCYGAKYNNNPWILSPPHTNRELIPGLTKENLEKYNKHSVITELTEDEVFVQIL